MGHERIKPHTWTVAGFFQSSQLEPADIQRDYQWTRQQVSQLITDLTAHMERLRAAVMGVDDGAPNEPYFLGSMVGTGVPPEISLYDGLQRSTTLTLLLCMLRDRVEDEKLAARLDACVHDGEGRPRLRLPEPDTTLQTAIQPRGATLKPIKGGFHGRRLALQANRRAILKAIKDWPLADIEAFSRMLLDDVYLVVLLVEGRPFAQRVFETTNMRGLAISPHDLIKGRLAQFASSDDLAATLAGKWDALRQGVSHDFAGFVDALVDRTLYYPSLTERSRTDMLVEWMAKRQGDKGERLIGWLDEADELSNPWNLVTHVSRSAFAKAKVLNPLLPIWPLDFDDWKPLAVEILSRRGTKGVSDNKVMGQLDMLQRRCMAVMLSRLSETARRALFRKALKEFHSGMDPFELSLAFTDEALRRRIRTTLRRPMGDVRLRRVLLKWNDAQGAQDNLRFLMNESSDARAANDPAEVEHILPQNVKEGSAWRDAFPTLEARSRMPDLLGNLILVPASVNRELDDKPFKDKQKILKKASKKRPEYQSMKEIGTYSQWTEAEIEARTLSMGEQIWMLLMLPDNPPFVGPDDELDILEAAAPVSDDDDLADAEDDVADPVLELPPILQ